MTLFFTLSMNDPCTADHGTEEDLIFDLFMGSMNASARASLFIVLIIVTKLNSVAILTDSVISSMEDSLSLISNYRLLTFVVYCFASFLLGLIFIVPNGYQLLHNTRYALEASNVLLLPLMVRPPIVQTIP